MFLTTPIYRIVASTRGCGPSGNECGIITALVMISIFSIALFLSLVGYRSRKRTLAIVGYASLGTVLLDVVLAIAFNHKGSSDR